MTVVLFEPHADDCVLFASFVAQRHQARVVTVLSSQVQEDRGYGITQQMRSRENDCAMRELGLEWTQWPYPDVDPDWGAVEAAMRALDDRLVPELVFAPLWEEGGHDQHNTVANLAVMVFGSRLLSYATYRRGEGRSEVGTRVVGTADQISRKLRALACYRSQIGEPSCQPWFLDGLVEWLA